MKYIGEHLLPGQLGHLLVILSFISSLIATIAYSKSANAKLPSEADSWKRLARASFIVDAISVFTVFGLILLIISNHYFEYNYAWTHSDKTLEPKYLLSSIWEGQEGSFLLWTLWHCVIGLILIRTGKKWEAPVMAVVSFAQVCLATMILGIYLFDIKIGNTPFMLLRHTETLQNAPMFIDASGQVKADYMNFITQRGGVGLNQLLQNYWMVIHPPILFLGFASTIVPFAFAIAGLWKKDFGGWTKQALPWSLFSAGVLGLGIMMGAKWAYESLSFGGYWAWDPVENASMVPWLVLMAGIHTLVIYNSTGHSLRATYFFFIFSFILVLYSTYLTRSGVLQDTSVHAFVTEGMDVQLISFLLIFLVPALGLYIARYKQIPHIAKEENSYSREFWMFIGSLVLFLSAIAITVPTSFPIINKLFGSNFVLGDDKEFPYNRIQVFVAIIIGILAALTQYLKYKNTSPAYFGKKILIPSVIALTVSILISAFGNIHYDKYGWGFLTAIHLAVFAGVYTIVSNAGYVWAGLNGKLKAAGGSVSHIGFGMLLVGILISSAKKEILSVNRFNPLNFGPTAKQEGFENLTLFQGVRVDMGDYWATYISDSTTKNGSKWFFRVDMEKKSNGHRFTLYPDLIKNTKGQEGYSNNPDSKHYWNKDIFSYVNHSSKMQDGSDTSKFRKYDVKVGDTLFYAEGFMRLDSVIVNPNNDKYNFTSSDTALMAKLSIVTSDSAQLTARPVYYVKDDQVRDIPDTLFSAGLVVALRKIKGQSLEISVKESSQLTPLIALKVLQFPFINLVWIGTLVMLAGIAMSIVRRVRLL